MSYKFKKRMLENPYTDELVNNVLTAQHFHEYSIINKHTTKVHYQSEINKKIKYLESIKEENLAIDTQSKKLRNLLVNFERNRDRIFNILRAF